MTKKSAKTTRAKGAGTVPSARTSAPGRKAEQGQTAACPLTLDWIPAGELRAKKNPRNWRTHPDAQKAALAEVLADPAIGWAGVLLYNEQTGHLIDGHARLELDSIADDDPVPVVTGSWTEAAERKILLTLDPLAAMAEADAGRLRELLEDTDLGTGPLNRIAQDLAEDVAGYTPTEPAPGQTDPDAIPDPAEKPRTKLGDLWLLGGHRLLCGDSTDAKAVARLLAGAGIDLVVTSPPYNLGIEYASYVDAAARDDYLGFLRKVAEPMAAAMKPGRFVAWNIGVNRNTYPARQVVMLEDAGLSFYRQIVWAKSGTPWPLFSQTQRARLARNYLPNYMHELIVLLEQPGVNEHAPKATCPLCTGRGDVERLDLVAYDGHETIQLMTKGDKPEKGGPINVDEKYKSDVWRIAASIGTRDLKTLGTKANGLTKNGKPTHMVKEHPAAFPSEVPRALMTFLTTAGEVVYDPFAGAGTTIIAAEQLGRRCCAMELEPRYCDTALRRWEDFTGKKATKEPRPAAKRPTRAKKSGARK